MMPTIDHIRVCKLDDAVVGRSSDWQQLRPLIDLARPASPPLPPLPVTARSATLDELSAIEVPVLTVPGGDERHPAEVAERMRAAIPDATLVRTVSFDALRIADCGRSC